MRAVSRRGSARCNAAEHLRAHLKLAGVTRAQLFESNESRLAIRAHDLRATFVTVSLALGKTEAWITDRTEHRSSQMIYAYKRAARTYAELGLGFTTTQSRVNGSTLIHGTRD